MITEKRCKHCNEVKPVRLFHKKHDSADGLYPYCKDCRRERSGYGKRETPRVRSEVREITMDVLIQDVISLSTRYPSNVKYRQAADVVRTHPNGPHDDFTASLLFECWQNRQRKVHDFEAMDETAPIVTMARAKVIKSHEFTNLFE